jgi:deoxyribose-phosphate aldolase
MTQAIYPIEKIIALLDLTRLQDHDTPEAILELCQRGHSAWGPVASLCVYPRFVSLVKQHSDLAVTTVVNFPTGHETLETVCHDIEHAIAAGADEIDIVTPYHVYLGETGDDPVAFLTECRRACGTKIMKVILETGALLTAERIEQASRDAVTAGADFLKTSTGKIGTGATLEAAQVMLNVIKTTPRTVGLKLSGGIRTLEQARDYLHLIESIMGTEWICRDHVRFGTSQLLEN